MTKKANLDDDVRLREVDRSGMADLIASLPDDMEALLKGRAPEAPAVREVSNIVFSGMGGSAIGGDIVRTWLAPALGMPVEVNRGYGLPPHAGPGTLFVSVSFSGNTEETLSAFDAAVGAGFNVVAISSGGELERRAKAAGVPHHRLDAPKGMVPRAALGHMVVPMALLLDATGLASVREELGKAVDHLKGMRSGLAPEVPLERNEAKKVATGLLGKIPVVNGHGVLSVAALRWKTQLNENSKVLAWADTLPEMDHNTIVGWEGDPAAGEHAVVILRDAPSESGDVRVRNRIEATKEAAWSKAGCMMEVHSEGEGVLTRVLSTIYKGDYTSLYLAVLRGVDPTPVTAIEDLKGRLKKAREG